MTLHVYTCRESVVGAHGYHVRNVPTNFFCVTVTLVLGFLFACCDCLAAVALGLLLPFQIVGCFVFSRYVTLLCTYIYIMFKYIVKSM